MAFARLGCGALRRQPARQHPPPRAEPELLLAAAKATEWAGDDPLILGGDFNVRPGRSGVFDELERRFGLRGATAPDSIDHLLVRGVETAGPPRAWPPERARAAQGRRGSAAPLRPRPGRAGAGLASEA